MLIENSVLADDIKNLAVMLETSENEVIMKALILFKMAVEAEQNNLNIAIVDQNNNILTKVSGGLHVQKETDSS